MERFIKALLLALGLSLPPVVFASSFDAAAFEAAQAAGKPILVEVHADWCPVCAKQKPITGKLLSRPEFRTYSSFTVDFDGQKIHALLEKAL